MKVKIQKTVSTDRLLLVNTNKLMHYENDILRRESQDVENAYHKNWFFKKDNFLYFKPPAAYISDGKIFFINGRHRTVLLSRYLNKFPFLIGNIDSDHIGWDPKRSSLEVFKDIRGNELEEYSVFILPDLPFGNFREEEYI